MKTETTKTETVKTEPVPSPVAVAVVSVDPLAAPAVPAPVTEEEREVEEVCSMERYNALVEVCNKLVSRVEALEKKEVEMKGQMTSALQFEEVATQAIDLIARNTSSNFAPSAKATVEPVPTGSIFEQARAKAAAAKAAK